MDLSEDKGGMAQEAIKYGDVFEMSGELAEKPISPRDAAAMKSAENTAFGKTVKGGPAELMHTAASKNLQAGLIRPDDDSGLVSDAKGKSLDDGLQQQQHMDRAGGGNGGRAAG